MALSRMKVRANGGRRRVDLVNNATAEEIDWTYVAPVLNDSESAGCEFVYAICEQPGGPVKIGRALRPVKRLRQLQTGNPRRLKIERVVYGGAEIEGMLHQKFREHVIGGKTTYVWPGMTPSRIRVERDTEWFEERARAEILSAMLEILQHQQAHGSAG